MCLKVTKVTDNVDAITLCENIFTQLRTIKQLRRIKITIIFSRRSGMHTIAFSNLISFIKMFPCIEVQDVVVNTLSLF